MAIGLHALGSDDNADIAAIEERLRKLRGDTAPPPSVEDLAARFKKLAGYDLMTSGDSNSNALGSEASADIAAANYLRHVEQSGYVPPTSDTTGIADEANAAILSVSNITDLSF